MRKVLLFILLVCSVASYAQTNVGGTISTDATWTLANSPYVVTSSVTVNNNATLTIESGVVVKFNDNLKLDCFGGTLNATGVTFTSNNASPTPGIWQGILLRNPTAHTLTGSQMLYATTGVAITEGSVDLSNSEISNSSQNGLGASQSTVTADNLTITGTGSNSSGISASNATLTISNSSINSSGYYGVLVPVNETGATSSTITSTTITGGTIAGIHVTENANLSLGGITFNNSKFPIRYASGAHITYTAPNIYNCEFNVVEIMANRSINMDVTLENPGIPYLLNNLTVIAGATLTILPDVIIKVDYGANITVNGDLIADGTDTNPIYFTSFADDNLGGDSNNNANDNSASNRPWYGIFFNSTSTSASLLDYCNIRWANYTSNGAAIVTRASSPTITNNTLLNSYFGVRFEGASSPVFTGNTIGSSYVTPVAMSFEANPTFSNNSFSTADNQYDAIGLIGGELTANANVIKRDFTDIPNVTYVLLDHVTVPVGKSLTIDAGVVIKSLSGYDFIINGKLSVNGTTEAPTIFTSVNDDNYGNPLDTRNDGTNQIPSIGNMGGFYFSETSDATSVINYAVIKFAYYNAQYQSQYIYDVDINSNHHWSFYYDAAICINRISPTISNTVISDVPSGIDVRGDSKPAITNNQVKNTTKAPMRLAVQSNPVFTGNTFNSVGRKGIGILPEVINYSDTLRQQNIAGFNNITYILTDLIINEGAEVVLDSGIIVKAEHYQSIHVFGGLKIRGTATDRVLITALADDNAGASTDPTQNDTEGNGNATDPNNLEWRGIIFYAASDDSYSKIEYADLKYSGLYTAPIEWRNSAATVENTSLEFSQNYGLYISGNSNPIVSNVTIRTSRLDPIGISYFADPTFSNIIFDTNGSNGLRLIDDQLSSNATIRKRDLAGISNIAYIMDNLTINSGATLTINPGVVIKKNPSSRIYIYEGAINATGTETEKIIFTSIKDDSRGGDTNIDGNGSSPAAGNWYGLYFLESTIQSVLKFCEIRYGSHANGGGSGHIFGTIISENNNLLVEDCLIQLSNVNAFGIYGTSTATLRNNRLENIDSYPVHLSMFSNPTFEGNTVENVKYMAIGVREESFTQSATFPFRSFAGVDSITYMPTYWYGYGFKITSGTKITVPAGMIFKSDYYRLFDVEGELHLAGTADKPIIFTSVSDDQYGRPLDTENNGPYQYTIGRNGAVAVFRNVSSDNSIVEHVLARYRDNAITLESASPTIDNNIFEKSEQGIYATGISEPVITNNTFRDLTFTPFTTSMVAYPSVTTGNVMEGTTYKAVRINTETLTQDTTLIKRAFGGINNIPYVFNGYTVGLGVNLTIRPGVIVKFSDGSRTNSYGGSTFIVKGSLKANGGPNSDSTIVFTSESDDFYGGDTNSDSTHTNGYYNWMGIVFENESSDSESIIENAIIRYSGGDGLTLNSASPTIKNTTFKDNGHYYGNRGGLLITGASNPVLSNNDFVDNREYGISNTGSFTVDATNTWWGHNSGPYHATLNTAGEGDQVIGSITFDPWATDNSLNPITGDVSLNGHVTAFDAALTLQDLAELITLSDRQNRAADVSDDKTISAMDASYILQYSAGLIQWFPAEAENKRTTQQFASTASKAIVSIENATLTNSTEELRIPITIDEIGKMYALETHIAVDEELELIRFEPASFNDVTFTSNINEEASKLIIAFAKATPATEEGILGHLVVKLRGEFSTKSELFITSTKVVGNETDVTSAAIEGRINVDNAILGVNDPLQQLLSIYPNPVNNNGAINMVIPAHLKDNGSVEMHDLAGKVIFRKEISKNDNHIRIPVNTYDKGIYLLKVQIGENLAESKVVID